MPNRLENDYHGENLQISIIKQNLDKAVQRLLKDDHFLLEYDVHEQAITHRIAVYIEPMFPEHHVDCEYNNDLDSESGRKQIKYPDNFKESNVRPDIIVHHRGLNGKQHNILIMELKKLPSTEEDLCMDRNKLIKFTSQEQYHHFCYQCGALVKLGVKDRAGEVEIEWFENSDSNNSIENER